VFGTPSKRERGSPKRNYLAAASFAASSASA